ncbi:MAG: RNA-binding protein [Bacteroidales bacterium]|nr:RNA-binding protein [Bacteroidales bacterium]
MNIFVSSLNFKTRKEDLEKLFAPYGEVLTSRIITDKMRHRSKGYGFVEMNDEAGQKAIEALNGTEFMGRTINVALSTSSSKKTHPSKETSDFPPLKSPTFEEL